MQLDKNLFVSIKYFITAALLLPWIGTEYSYLALLVVFFSAIFFSKLQKSKLKSISSKILYGLPFLIFISWMYGVVVGLINNVPISHVFSNFFGLSVYLIFYALSGIGFDNKSIYKIILNAALVVLLYDGWLLAAGFIEGGVFSIIAESISDYRVKYDPAVLYFSPFILSFMIFVFGPSRLRISNMAFPFEIKNALLVMLFSVIFILLTMSKGIILVYVGFLLVSLIFAFSNLIFNFKATKAFLLLILFLVVFVVKYFDILIFVVNSFGKFEDSNAVRDLQFSYIFDEISFVGAGLGAPLRSGYYRSEDAPYGFELTYLNLMHKLGFMSGVLFFSYVLVIFQALRNIIYRHEFWMSVFVLGLMSYLVVGYGNPILIAPNFVLIHVLSMIILINCSNKNNEKLN